MGESTETEHVGGDGWDALAGKQGPDEATFKELRFFPKGYREPQSVAEKWHLKGPEVWIVEVMKGYDNVLRSLQQPSGWNKEAA